MNRVLFFALPVAFLLSACAGIPHETNVWEAAPPLPQQWVGAEQTASHSRPFWEQFEDPVLLEMLEKLRKGSPNIKIAAAQLGAARAGHQDAWADFYPEVRLSGEANRTHLSKRELPTDEVFGETQTPERLSNRFAAPLTLSYEPDIWGKIRDVNRAAHRELTASKADLKGIRLLQETLLAESYFQRRFVQQEIHHLRLAQQHAKDLLSLLSLQRAAGITSADDMLQAERSIRDLKKQISVRASERESLKYTIAVLLGETPQDFELPMPLDVSENTSVPVVNPGLPTDLLLSRPDVIAAENRLKATGARLDEARKAFLPDITLSGQYGFASRTLSRLVQPDALAWHIGAELVGVIFDGGRRAARIDMAEAEKKILLEEYRQTILNALVEVETALVQRQSLSDRLKAQKEQLKSLEYEYALAMERLKQGVTDKLEILALHQTIEQERIVQGELDMAYRFNAVALYKALGGSVNETP